MSQSVATRKAEFPAQLDKYGPQLKQALPSHITVDRFKRVVLTAVSSNPKLLAADRQSLFTSAVKCASDGLMPDGREAALVEFGGRVQYMPMVRGLLKLARQSGEIASISAHIVREHDEFEYVLGDDERLIHRPNLDESGRPRLVYATVTFKDGTRQREVMTVADVEKVRAVSRAKNNGPWVQWWDEMARKTVIRRLLKYVPTSTDRLAAALERDEETEFEAEKRAALKLVDADPHEAGLAALGQPAEHITEDGEIIEDAPEDEEPVDAEYDPWPERLEAWRQRLAASHNAEEFAMHCDAISAEQAQIDAPVEVVRQWKGIVMTEQRSRKAS